MTRILGLAVGALWFVFSFLAFQHAAAGRAMDAPDVAFWWSVIATLLAIAATGAVVGTIVHTRGRS
jgi:VIT1/CCC1 family predicted Fe2+/Mn2+ transporter